MTRPAPHLIDCTPEELFLNAISNPWRREVIAYCTQPRSKRDVWREFVCAGKNQRQHALACILSARWLIETNDDFYHLNPTAPAHLSYLIGTVVWQGDDTVNDPAACDAAVAALRRQSCRAILARLEQGPARFAELRELSGVSRREFLVSCTTLTLAHAIIDEKPTYRLSGAGLPGLEGWLNRISVTPTRSARAQASEEVAA